MISENKKNARYAGLWWLLFIVIGPISYLIVDGKLLIPDDPTATIGNINSHVALFWLGVAVFLAGYTCFIMLAKTLCKLFKPVDAKLTKWMMLLVIIGTSLVIIGKITEIMSTYVSNINDATFLLNLRINIEMICELFWGLWLIPLALLILKSNLIPKAIGWILFTTVAYHILAFVVFFISGTDISTDPVLVILGMGEIITTLWLLIKGVKTQK